MTNEQVTQLKPERRSSWLEKHPAEDQSDVIQVLRTTQQHHVTLGMIADQKANIVLGAFLIFITVTRSILEKDSSYNFAVWILTFFFALSALFALMVIAPRFRHKLNRSTTNNLLFFGYFINMSQEEYIKQLNDHMQDNAQARELIIKDIYQLGQVLNKKYRNLRLSYTSLAAGIVCSVCSFAVLQMLP